MYFISYPFSILNSDKSVTIMNGNLTLPVLRVDEYIQLQRRLSNIEDTKSRPGALIFTDQSAGYFNILSEAGHIIQSAIYANKIPKYSIVAPFAKDFTVNKFIHKYMDVKETYFNTSLYDLFKEYADSDGSASFYIQNGKGDITSKAYSIDYISNGDVSVDRPLILLFTRVGSGSSTHTNSDGLLDGYNPILIHNGTNIIGYASGSLFGYASYDSPVVTRVRTISYYTTFPDYTTNISSAYGGILSHLMLATGTEIDPSDTDPFTPGDNSNNSGGSGTSGGDSSSNSGGGNGNFNGDSDNVPDPSTRDDTSSDASVVNAGLISLYSPTQAQLTDLAQYLWSGAFSLESFRKIFADPMDTILGLSIVPVKPNVGGSKVITVGNIATGVWMNYVSSQYVQLDCGSVTLNEYWGAFLDYSPYTKVTIYLPYIGTRQLDVDEVMKQTINVTYNIDLLSGACVCFIKAGDSVLYQFTGSVSTQIPITSISYNNMYKAMVDFASSVAIGVAVGSPTMSTLPTVTEGLGQTGPATPSDVIIPYAENYMSDSETVRTIMSTKPQVSKGGNIGSSAGQLAIQKPYLIVERPRQCVPKKQNSYTGYPSFQTKQVSSQSGYTTWATIHLESLTATADEKNEIGMIMKKGVIL